MSDCILAIDQGTTSSRAILFSTTGECLGSAQQEFPQHFPHDGWVEHQPEQIWDSVYNTVKQVIEQTGIDATRIISTGITNQRETTLIWDRATGEAVYPAIVWQDRRTSDMCHAYSTDEEFVHYVQQATGLLLDPYFSATKIRWILDNVDGARTRAERGELAFGTVDTYLLWRLTDGKRHATDATNASRTMLFNLHQQCWDPRILSEFDIPASLLPDVLDNAAEFGQIAPHWFGAAIPVQAMAGDQQAALVGQACFSPGMVKSTYGTGCFMIANTGDQPVQSQHRLLTTLGYRLNGKPTYALEGSIFMAGATVQWLRDGLKLIASAEQSEALAKAANTESNVYLVPAFTGLGAPYWDPDARGALLGLTRDTGINEIVAAGLQSVCYQTRDLLEAMNADGLLASCLRVDGGMSNNQWVMAYLADTLGIQVQRSQTSETTALGVAYLAALQAGVFNTLEEIAERWQQGQTFEPRLSEQAREKAYDGWRQAIDRIKVGSD
ncbi:glycerol kinase GlpK [Aestuariibacter halophilus]|uniref:Glycerol kinase n=1 Tax=Fluctibacter halophilus TaxID=226011 RepID=A0ABS8G3F1_9ALTE|nr:glycerol kinase GlpK [Aestuariibacter halophilus]MCC2614631.1 glycerol kinase GlpK [Aestuariibacter halophilus]